MKSCAELSLLLEPVLAAEGIEVGGEDVEFGVRVSRAYVEKVIGVIKDRATFVADLWTAGWFLFKAPSSYEPKDVAKFWTAENAAMVREAVCACSDCASLEEYIRTHEWPMGKVMNSLRLSLTGAASGLGISEIMSCLPHEEILRRVEALID